MSRIIGIAVLVMIAVGVLGIVIPGIYKARAEQDLRRCQNNLRTIGSFAVFHSCLPNEPVPIKAEDRFPSGTLPNPNLNPEERLSWYALVAGAIDQGPTEPNPTAPARKPSNFAELLKGVQSDQAWNAEANLPLARFRLTTALCPATAPVADRNRPSLAQYIGMGGIGQETPGLETKEPSPVAGVFNYYSAVSKGTIVNGDGLSNTISLAETTLDLGPWLQGGPSTVRGLDPNRMPYAGPGAQFSGSHPALGNYGIADGSVRIIRDNIDPHVFRALLTIAGNETNEAFIDP